MIFPGSASRPAALAGVDAVGLLGTLVSVVGALTDAVVSLGTPRARESVSRPVAEATTEDTARVTARAVPSWTAVAVSTLVRGEDVSKAVEVRAASTDVALAMISSLVCTRAT